jgi:hypothetical protein
LSAVLGYGLAIVLSYSSGVKGHIILVHCDYYLPRALLLERRERQHPEGTILSLQDAFYRVKVHERVQYPVLYGKSPAYCLSE